MRPRPAETNSAPPGPQAPRRVAAPNDPAERRRWRELVRRRGLGPRAILAADYLSRLDTFPAVYPSYRVLGLELGAPSIPEYDENDPQPYRRAVWTAQQRGKRALRDLEDAGLLERQEHRSERSGAQRANDYLCRTPGLLAELLVRAMGCWGLRARDQDVRPPRHPGAPSDQDRQQDREQQQAAPPAPPAAPKPAPVLQLVPAEPESAADSIQANPPRGDERNEGRVVPSSGPSSPAISELARRRLQIAVPECAAAIVALCARPEHFEVAEHAVQQLLRKLEREAVDSPVGYVARTISSELAQRAAAPPAPVAIAPAAPVVLEQHEHELEALARERIQLRGELERLRQTQMFCNTPERSRRIDQLQTRLIALGHRIREAAARAGLEIR